MQMQHHGPPVPPPPPPGPAQGPPWAAPSRHIVAVNEALWMQIGSFSELLGNLDEAMIAYERALAANPNSIPAMNAISLILRTREDFHKAIEYLQAILKIDANNGEVWGSLGHCYLMMDDLQQAYAAYQSALVNLQNPKEPKLWYGIGILYDRYGSLDHAEEAFSQVMQMQPDFEKANEIYFRLGIIYKQQSKYGPSLECFKYIVNSPPPPLTEEDIWFQIGHVHEQQKDYDSAKAAYMRVLERDPSHAKVLQQLGWLHHQQSNSFQTQERAIEYLEKSVAADNNDAQSWYLLGRCYMSQQKYPKAYEAYQQAVYRDGRNPTFWCSIGVLYYQINQYRDALDAYSRAIRLNPYISEVWYDLGTLYESCNNQINDALDAYQRAAELDPTNPHIKARLQLLRAGQTPGSLPQAVPTDVHPHSYGAQGPQAPPWTGSAPMQQQSGPGGPHRPPPGPAAANGWGQRASDINPPQPPNPYEQREPFRGPAPPLPRQPSPRQEMRQYGESKYVESKPQYVEPNRPGIAPIRRGPSPGPPTQYGPPPPGPSQQPPPPPTQGPARVNNPNYTPAPSSNMAPANGPPNGAPPPHSLMPYRNGSPRSEPRPIHDNRMPSPKSAYPQHQPPFSHHQEPGMPGSIESGVPHLKGMMGPDMHRDHDRPASVASKRMREWEDEPAMKKPASEETRARMDDIRHRRPSTPPRDTYRRSPDAHRFEEQQRMEEQRRVDEQRRVEEMRRAEEQRHAVERYHPSDAAHHPPAHSMPNHLPPMQQGPPPPMQGLIHEAPQPSPAPKDYPQDEQQRLDHAPAPPPSQISERERAARKMEVDDDYDDSGEEEKKVSINGAASGPGSAAGDIKNTTPTSAGINGMMGPGSKVEGSG